MSDSKNLTTQNVGELTKNFDIPKTTEYRSFAKCRFL